MTGTVRRWPLFLIASPAAVAVWSGWVGLGGMCGFGSVRLLPGITDLTVNTAITLPGGVEAYGAYALGAWLASGQDSPARTFARRSAIGALCLGMLGQVAYHLLAAAHAHRAPWPVVVLVSCMPVVTLGFGAALTHLLRTDLPAAEHTAPDPDTAVPVPPAALNGHGERALELFGSEVTRGSVPGIRRIRSELAVGQPKAQEVRAYLAEVAEWSAPRITGSIAASGVPAKPQVTASHTGDG
jgi:hypothetical protein